MKLFFFKIKNNLFLNRVVGKRPFFHRSIMAAASTQAPAPNNDLHKTANKQTLKQEKHMDSTKKSPDQAFEDSFDEYLGKLDEHGGRVAAATELLPAWFVARMMDDVWQFGLMLTSGRTIGISQILNVTEDKAGNIWIDAVMLECDPGQTSIDILTAPCPERLNISINARHIVGALEIAYT